MLIMTCVLVIFIHVYLMSQHKHGTNPWILLKTAETDPPPFPRRNCFNYPSESLDLWTLSIVPTSK
jgi:hypothetical protein